MSIPYNESISLYHFKCGVNVNDFHGKWTDKKKTAKGELISNAFQQPVVRTVQFIRDTARLILKVPVRAIANPIFLEKNWRERERAKVNVKLTGYAFVQMVSVPVKFMVALVALGITPFSKTSAEKLINKSAAWTAHLDGCASRLEALKEEGAKGAKNRNEYNGYKDWLYNIDAKLFRKMATN